MRIEDFKKMVLINEPEFGYKGFEYTIARPNGYFTVYAEDSPSDEDLVFETIDELLDHWMIQGKPLKEIIPELEF